jgi:hypothetical protein
VVTDTATYAGSAGTNANCEAVLTALGLPGLVTGLSGGVGLGCTKLTFCDPSSRLSWDV